MPFKGSKHYKDSLKSFRLSTINCTTVCFLFLQLSLQKKKKRKTPKKSKVSPMWTAITLMSS